ncbi:MAG TPA: cupin domain-containing protein [Terriglobales bacterium]|nr:cupin domain-containing protein [Terriglobales bacterium]
MTKMRDYTIGVAVALLVAGGFLLRAQSSPAGSAEESDRRVLSQKLPKMNGDNLTVHLVEVDYPVGIGSEPHSHPCPVIGYVVNGAIESQVKGSPGQTYEAGKAFYEPPNGIHQVSKDGSPSQTSRLLAIFICDRDVPLSGPPTPDAHMTK